MSSVVDFLEKMGSEAHWRYASQDAIQTALTNAGVDAPVRTAILARNADAVQALLGRVKMMPTQTGPGGAPVGPHEVPKPPQPAPGEQEEEKENDGAGDGKRKPSKNACGASSLSSHASP
jgi:hypothetical protein